MISRELSLLLYDSVLDSPGNFLFDFGFVPDWTRSIRALGGFWQGSFSVPARFARDMVSLFYECLGAHLEERSPGGTTWAGLVYEMELSYNGIRRRRSLDTVVNALDVSYSYEGETTDLGFDTLDRSIDRYGRREDRISLDGAPSATATGFRSRYLAANGWPWARPVSIGSASAPELTVKVCGYAFTANWQYVTATGSAGTTDDIDDWIGVIVGSAFGLSSDHGGAVSGAGDCQFIKAGSLRSNTLQVPTAPDSDIKAWSLIAELAGLGDSSGDPWLAWVDSDRLLHYDAADLDPQFILRDNGIYKIGGGAPLKTWELWPGAFRDLAYPIRRAEPGSIFSDARDLWVDEVEAGADGSLSLKTALFDQSAIFAAQLEQERSIQETGG